MFLFHRECFPFELLLNLYDLKFNLSVVDFDDVANTIILNKYDSKNIMFHWSDLSVYKTYYHAFIAHNVYLAWGNIHYDCHADNYFVDKKINIGCIYKSEFNKAIRNKKNIITRLDPLRSKNNIVTFFDSYFSVSFFQTENFFLRGSPKPTSPYTTGKCLSERGT